MPLPRRPLAVFLPMAAAAVVIAGSAAFLLWEPSAQISLPAPPMSDAAFYEFGPDAAAAYGPSGQADPAATQPGGADLASLLQPRNTSELMLLRPGDQEIADPPAGLALPAASARQLGYRRCSDGICEEVGVYLVDDQPVAEMVRFFTEAAAAKKFQPLVRGGQSTESGAATAPADSAAGQTAGAAPAAASKDNPRANLLFLRNQAAGGDPDLGAAGPAPRGDQVLIIRIRSAGPSNTRVLIWLRYPMAQSS